MSLRVDHLTKIFGQQRAVDDVSFTIHQGEIVGFLGPNGAGKSTTMKIATGFLPATEGIVEVSGVDVAENPMHIKRITGYLPEHNPLYLDMYVHEYLHFVGGLYNLSGHSLTSRVKEMIGMCGLEKEQNKKIESLSKGYRQRVGLAQALIHNPEVLILDEPTSGLDPHQIVEIRKLIKEVSVHKTVIFSTHIMQEVQAMCDRVIVINRGKIVADNQLTQLLQRQNEFDVLVVEFKEVISAEATTSWGALEVVQEGKKFKIKAAKGDDVRPRILRYAADHNLSLVSLQQEENSLEEIFRELTQAQTVA
jgi:ABC-2 type transport system ATP-binding protein